MHKLKKVFSEHTIILLSQIFVSLKSFIIVMILTKTLTQATYGNISQLNSIASFVLPLVIFGTNTSIIRLFSSKNKIEKVNGFTNGFVISNIFIVIMSFLIFIARRHLGYIFFGNSEQIDYRFFMLILMLLISQLYYHYALTWFQLDGKSTKYSIFRTIESFVIVLAYFVFSLTVDSYIRILLFVYMIDIIGSLLIILKHLEYKKNILDSKLIKQLLRIGITVFPSGYAMWILNLVDRLILPRYTSMAELGKYALAYSVSSIFIQTIFASFFVMLATKLAEYFDLHEFDLIDKYLKGIIQKGLFWTVPMICGMLIMSDDILPIISTKEYSGLGVVMFMTGLGYLFHVFSSMYANILLLYNKYYHFTISLVIASIVNVVLNILFIPRFGINAAAVTTMVSFFIQMVYIIWIQRKYYKIIFNLPSAIKSSLASIIMMVLLINLRPHILFGPVLLRTIVTIFLAVVIYFLFQFIFYKVEKKINTK